MRISLVHTKGGVGKTTNTIMLATAAARRGIDVEVLDADPQGSATRWAEVASMREDKLEFPVRSVDARRLQRFPASDGWQIVEDRKSVV